MLYLLTAIILFPIFSFFVYPIILCDFWKWFIVPVLGVDSISHWQAFGMLLFLSLFKRNNISSINFNILTSFVGKKKKITLLGKEILISYTISLLIWIVGWLIHN